MVMIQGPSCCSHGIRGYGPSDAKILAIGIAPGRDEAERTKRPLTGPSGQLFDAILQTHGILRDDVYCTNLICWWKDKPERSEIEVCHHRLLSEIELINPKIILLLGALACESILGMKLSKARGAVIPLNNRYYLATNHPAAALHTGVTLVEKELQINAAYDIIRDLAKLTPILEGNYSNFNPITYTVIDSVPAAQELLDSLPESTVAIDIETIYDKEADRSHPFSDAITCIGIGYEDDHAYVLTHNALSTSLKWPKYTRWLYHNGQFDTQEIAQHLGSWLPISEDTMLQSYCCDERSERGLHKLKHLAREWVGSDFYEEDEHRLDGTLESYNRLYEYNAKDVCYTYRLHKFLTSWQQREGASIPYESLLLPASEILARSQYRGIYIDPVAVEEIEVTLGVKYVQMYTKLKTQAKQAGFDNFNPNSPIQVKEILSSLDYHVISTNKYVLQELLDHDEIPFVKDLLTYRTLAKLILTYLHPTLAQIKFDGRVHPHAFTIGTVTGRLTYKDPPMQTLPKPKTVKELGVIRKIFAATSSDYVLLEADYAQIEAWLGAYFSKDPVLLADLQSGNWHTKTTEDVFNVHKADVDSQTWAFYYDGGKHLNYGCMFGEAPNGLTRRPPIGMGCSLQEARFYHQRWYDRYKVYAMYQREQQRKAREDAEIVTPFGRKRRFPIIVNNHQMNQAINYEIQSTAHDYVLTAMIRLYLKLQELATHLLIDEQDALYYEVYKPNLKEVITLVKSVMESPPLPGLPSIKVEMDIGNNLAELHPWCMECIEPMKLIANDKYQCPSCGKIK